MLFSNTKITVADVGARYGIHPNWSDYNGPIHYIAFEPDEQEAARLEKKYSGNNSFDYTVLSKALDKFDGDRDFHLLRHRGLSSCLKPLLESECFRHLKPNQAEIDQIISMPVQRLDTIAAEIGKQIDFLKVDTEGTEQDVIEGAGALLDAEVLGIRSSCNFQPCFGKQKLFHETQSFLLDKGFVLLNLDYLGYGYPRLGLFRKPDPTDRENSRYGTLVACDGVWIKSEETLENTFSGDDLTVATMKVSAFCFLNNAPDVGIDMFKNTIFKNPNIGKIFEKDRLFLWLKLHTAKFLGRYRTVPDSHWENAQQIYKVMFNETLLGGSEFYPQLEELEQQANVSA